MEIETHEDKALVTICLTDVMAAMIAENAGTKPRTGEAAKEICQLLHITAPKEADRIADFAKGAMQYFQPLVEMLADGKMVRVGGDDPSSADQAKAFMDQLREGIRQAAKDYSAGLNEEDASGEDEPKLN